MPETAPAACSLANILNSDGTLRAGLSGSFDARGYELVTMAGYRQPVFRPVATQGVGDENWQNGSGLPGANGEVKAMARASNGDLYVGRNFTVIGSVAAKYIARWDGTRWYALGSGFENEVTALTIDGNGRLYAGGAFQQAGSLTVNYVAAWDGTRWQALGTGLDARGIGGPVALAPDGRGGIYVGDGFLTVGDSSKVTAYFGHYNPAGFPTATPAPVAAMRLYPNPAHASVTLLLPPA